jgi:hypothetical protein
VSSPRLPNPQNSPEESGQPPPSSLQTPPVTSFFTPFSSRIERVVQQIISPKTLFPLNWDNILILGVFTT